MARPLPLAQHTLYAELLEQGIGDLFDPRLPENGSILVRGNRAGAAAAHAYYQGYRPAGGGTARGQRFARYLGRADDPAVAALIVRFQRIKALRGERSTTVRALIGAGMSRPDRSTGRILEALARVGLFPDHGVLIGEAAYHTYDGVLGMRLARPRRAAGSDRPAITIVVADPCRLPGILDAVHAVDSSFAVALEGPDKDRTAKNVAVFVAHLDRDAVGTAGLLGFLVTNPVQAIVLHGPGIPVTVPTPERYAVYTLIEACLGPIVGASKTRAEQVRHLVEVLRAIDRDHKLAAALKEASMRDGPWQAFLQLGIDALITMIDAVDERWNAG